MCANTARGEVGSPRRPVDQRRHGRTTGQRGEGCIDAKKDMFVPNVRSPVFQVGQNRIACILRQWQRALSSALSSDSKSALLPIDVSMTQMYDIACAQSKPN